MRLTPAQKAASEARLRAAMDRLLAGVLPPGGKCDVKTLAAEAGIARSALYATYANLTDEFETRRQQLVNAGTVVDPRQTQLARLQSELAGLRKRLADRDIQLADLTAFRATAISRLASQHTEIEQLRQQLARNGNIVALHRTAHSSVGDSPTVVGPYS